MDPQGYRYLLACNSIGALQAAAAAAERYEQKAKEAQEDFAEPAPSVDGAGEVDTIYKALTWGPLGQSYNAMFETWLAQPEQAFLSIERLAEEVELSVSQVQARFSKLSGRLRRVASAEELEKSPKTALGLLVDAAFDAAGSPSHRLTPAGRVAVRRYVGE